MGVSLSEKSKINIPLPLAITFVAAVVTLFARGFFWISGISQEANASAVAQEVRLNNHDELFKTQQSILSKQQANIEKLLEQSARTEEKVDILIRLERSK